MSDIIQDAKQLLDAATPGPWELVNGEIRQIQHAPEQCTSIRCDHRWPVLSESWGESAAVAAEGEDLALMAAVPDMAQALAEETYEYAVQFKNEDSGKWYTNGFYGRGMHGQTWFDSQEEAKRQIERSYPVGLVEPRKYRIVRRRVSPPEVINE